MTLELMPQGDSVSTVPSPTLKTGERMNGFTVRRVTALGNLRAQAYELEHDATGAQLLHVHAHDAENLFCIAFRTPPRDDTGLPHILEHVVLGGSQRFPVRDPFIEMVKMSMATFINAMTYADKTVYPVASNVRQDFYNLAEVYCDAVFHPRLTEASFQQEGHHLEFAKKDDPSTDLIVKGIVFNEMKGAYSAADSFVDRESYRQLFPDTTYGLDSGGNPERIPDLTYADFKRFYADLYHPSNAFIFLYGDIPTADHLAFLKRQLESYTRRPIDTAIPKQPRWTQPRDRSERYPIGGEEELDEKAYVTLNWIVGDGTDAREVIAWKVLDRILLGNQAAPLRKALIDSQLGQDLTHAGFGTGELETTFHAGLKGTEADRKDRIVAVVMDTLKRLADEGIPADKVEAAFHQVSYGYLEIASMFPLWLMDRAYNTWIYGADPLIFLRADEHLEAVRQSYAQDPQLFQRLIRKGLLENPHRSTLVFTPDPKLLAEKEEAFAARMRARKAQLSELEKRQLVEQAKALEVFQNTPNTPEALATLPQLKASDLPRKPKHIPTRVETLNGGVPLLVNDVFANGVNYLHVDLNLQGLPERLYPYLPLYGECVTKMGAAGLDYVGVAERMAAHTGGIQFNASFDGHAADPNTLVLSGQFTLRALDGKLDQALALLHDLYVAPDFSDLERLKDVVVQAYAEHRSSIVHDGIGLGVRHAGRGLSLLGHLNELTGGLPQIRLVERWAEQFESHQDDLVARLNEIAAFLRNRKRLTASFTGSEKVTPALRKALERWAQELGADPLAPSKFDFAPAAAPAREGLAAPMEVAFCTQVLPAPHLSHADSPLLTVASRLLSLDYMWEQIRVKGGAYGGGVGYNGIDSAWYYYSYRDPWVKKTLDNFAGLRAYVTGVEWSQTDIDRAIIGTAKNGEKPIRPADATGAALWRHTHGDTPDRREARHAAILSVTPQAIKRAVLDQLDRHAARIGTCVVSSRLKLEEANRELGDAALAIEDILTS